LFKKPETIKEVDVGVKQVDTFEQIKKLEEQKQTLVKAEKEKLVEQGRAIVGKLKELGFSYDFGPMEDGKGTKKSRQPRICKVCGFATEPVHDERRHKKEQKKGPFDNKDLERMGFKKRTISN